MSKEKETALFVLCIWLFLIRIAIPFVKYLFIPCFILFLVYTVFRILKAPELKKLNSYYFRVFSAFLLVCVFFFTGILLSSNLDYNFLKEGLTIFVLIGFGIMAFSYIENEKDFKLFTWIFMRQLLVFCTIICFLSLVKLFFLLRGVKFEFLTDLRGLYPRGTSLVIDYNFYSLLNILGIVTACFIIVKERSGVRSFLLQLLVFGLIFNVMFSTSRRGIVVLAFVLVLLFLVLLFGWLAGKETWVAVLSRKLRLVFIFFFGFLFLFILFLYQKPFHSESSPYVNLGFDRTSGRDLLYTCAVRYFTIIDPQSKDAAMDQNFKRFRETGELRKPDNLSRLSGKPYAMNPADSLKYSLRKEENADDYLGVILTDPDNRFTGGRIQRANFGIKIFSEQYSTSKKIIGGGFDYLWDFGHQFYHKNHDRFYLDYPHNPIISAFLYSGIIGGLGLVYFFCMTFLNFIRGFRSLLYFICLYAIIFFFAFFSGNSIFGSPEFAFVSLVPFYFTIVKYREAQMCRRR